jgi:hypothetical protein
MITWMEEPMQSKAGARIHPIAVWIAPFNCGCVNGSLYINMFFIKFLRSSTYVTAAFIYTLNIKISRKNMFKFLL